MCVIDIDVIIVIVGWSLPCFDRVPKIVCVKLSIEDISRGKGNFKYEIGRRCHSMTYSVILKRKRLD